MKPYCFLAFLILLVACKKDAKLAMKPRDLLQYGIPMTIMTPDSVTVKAGTLSFAQDITIKGQDERYNLQIFGSNATSTNMEEVKATHLAEIKDNRYFSKIIQEDKDGFIYQMAIDSTNLNHGFKYIRLQGDKEYVFQTALVGTFSLEDAKMMYEAVKQK